MHIFILKSFVLCYLGILFFSINKSSAGQVIYVNPQSVQIAHPPPPAPSSPVIISSNGQPGIVANKPIIVQTPHAIAQAQQEQVVVSSPMIPVLPPGLAMTDPSAQNLDPDLSEPTRVIDVNGVQTDTTETSDYVVPTRIIVPKLAGPDTATPSLAPPIQHQILSSDMLHSRNIVPFKPAPEDVEPLQEAPKCPVNTKFTKEEKLEDEDNEAQTPLHTSLASQRSNNSNTKNNEKTENKSESLKEDDSDEETKPEPPKKKKKKKKKI